MNGCKDILPLVAARSLGVLEPHEESGVTSHLARCESCRAFAEDVTAALIECTPADAHAPDAAWGRIAAGLGGEAAPRKLGVGLGAVAALLLGALLIPLALWRAGPPAAEVAEPVQPPPVARAISPRVAPQVEQPESEPEPPARSRGHDLLDPATEAPVSTTDPFPAPPLASGGQLPPGVVGRAFTPDDAKALIDRAWEKLRREDWAGAEALADEAIALEPGVGAAWEVRARALIALGRHEEAMADLHHAIELDPRQPRVYELLAEAQVRAGRYAEARASVDRALALDPSWSDAWLLRARIRFDMGDPRGALADTDRALELAPNQPQALVLRANIREVLGDYEGRDLDLDRAAELGAEVPPPPATPGQHKRRFGRER